MVIEEHIEISPADIERVEIVGRRWEDGRVFAFGRSLPDWPEQVGLFGSLFRLEQTVIEDGRNDRVTAWYAPAGQASQRSRNS